MYLYLFTCNHDEYTQRLCFDDETFSASPMTAPEESHHPPLMTSNRCSRSGKPSWIAFTSYCSSSPVIIFVNLRKKKKKKEKNKHFTASHPFNCTVLIIMQGITSRRVLFSSKLPTDSDTFYVNRKATLVDLCRIMQLSRRVRH